MQRLKIVLFFLLSFQFQLIGEHIIGGQFSYTCLSQGNYQFQLDLFRDCGANGAPFDSAPGSFTIGSVTVYAGDQEMQTINLDEPSINLLALNVPNNCFAVPDFCIQKGQYIFELNLPKSSEPYYIVYQRCCRNNTLSNIIQPGVIGLTFVQEIIPAAQTLCNSSPTFVPFNRPIICANEFFTADNGAMDTDNDELKYSFCSPFSGGAIMNPAPNPDLPPPYEPVPYILPAYSAQNPLGQSANITIDSITGIISGTASLQGQYVVGVCIEELRNGKLLSLSKRDFQFNVLQCDSSFVTDTSYTEVITGETYQGITINADTTLVFEAVSSLGCDSLSVHIIDAVLPNSISTLPKDFFSLYPNPALNQLNLQFKREFLNHQYAIFNARGELFNSGIISTRPALNISISTLPTGVYYFSIKDEDQFMVKRFVKL